MVFRTNCTDRSKEQSLVIWRGMTIAAWTGERQYRRPVSRNRAHRTVTAAQDSADDPLDPVTRDVTVFDLFRDVVERKLEERHAGVRGCGIVLIGDTAIVPENLTFFRFDQTQQ